MHPHDDHGTHVIMLIPGTHIYNFRPCSYWNPAECTCSGSTATCPSGSCWSWSWSSTVPIRFNERLSCLRDQKLLLVITTMFVTNGQLWSIVVNHRQPRHHICRDRCDRRSRNFFVNCVNFSANSANHEKKITQPPKFLHKMWWNSHI